MNAPFTPERSITIDVARTDDAATIGRIEAYVDAHPDATPFHSPRWLGAVEQGCGQRTHFVIAERAGAIVAYLPLTEVHSPLFGRALVSSGFAVEGGILSDDAAAAIAIEEAAWRLAERVACPTLELRGGTVAGPDWHRAENQYCYFSRAVLPDDAAELLSYPRKQRAEVRRSLTFDLTMTTGSGDADRRAHYRVYSESVRNLGSPVFPRALFDAMLDAWGDDADILTVWKDDVPIASTLSLYWRGTMYAYWGGGTHAARRWRGNDRMYYAMMRHAHARGCTRFDLGRSKVGTGAAAFKRSFGFEARPLVYFHRTASGTEPRAINPLDPKFSASIALWQRLPLSIANRIGPAIARGLG